MMVDGNTMNSKIAELEARIDELLAERDDLGDDLNRTIDILMSLDRCKTVHINAAEEYITKLEDALHEINTLNLGPSAKEVGIIIWKVMGPRSNE